MRYYYLKKYEIVPLLLSLVLFLGCQFLIFNIGLGVRDEGFLVFNAIRILKHQVPYRDFFLTTTPGTYYIQAWMMSVFGNYIVLDRILYSLLVVSILFVLWRFLRFHWYICLIALISLAIEYVGPSYAFYNTEALLGIILSVLVVGKYTKRPNFVYAFLLALLSAVTFWIKQSYGLADMAAILLCICFIAKPSFLVRQVFSYISILGFFAIIYLLYLLFQHAFNSFFYYVFVFAREVKSHRTSFLFTALLFIPSYLFILWLLRKYSLRRGILLFLSFVVCFFLLYFLLSPARVGRFLVVFADPLVYYYFAFLLVPLTILYLSWSIRYTQRGKSLVLLALFCLLLFLASAASGRDYTTVLMVSPLFLPLCLLFSKYWSSVYQRGLIGFLLVVYMFPFLLSAFNLLHSNYRDYINIEGIPEAAYLRIPKKQAKEVQDVVQYIKTNVPKNSTILCFPYCPLLYVLSERNSASYFSFFYQETFRTEDQTRVLRDLRSNKPKMVILQRQGIIEQEARNEDLRLAVLKKYFLTYYHLTRRTPDFAFYVLNKLR